jgi:hemerythrin superfamily protein
MDIYDYIKKDHRKVSELFKKALQEEDPAKRDEIFGHLKDNLLLHAHSEQETFYKELEKHEKLINKIQHAEKEHEKIEALVHSVTSTSPWDETWFSKVEKLRELVDHHVDEEENKIFPAAQKVITEAKAKELETAMKEYKTLVEKGVITE